ncbi:MAG: hypothetical protein U5K00_06000 [Melioribacteraceae bacterium]|nr:hypothetical protein [Melioribacteraceae bacterium]
MQLIDGKKISDDIKDELKVKIDELISSRKESTRLSYNFSGR